jgi:hypothetical protein
MRRELRPLAALAMVTLIAAGCSSGSAENGSTGTGSASTGSTSTGSTGSSKTATNREKAMKFAECMRDNGVSAFPDPNASGELTIDGIANGSSLDPNTAAFRKAMSACKDLEPSGFTGHTRSAQEQEHALEFAQCMRDNGVRDFPDPTRNGPLIDTTRIPSAAGRGALSIPGFQAAVQKCTAIYSGELGLKRQ